MANSLYIDTTGFTRLTDKLKGMEKVIVGAVDEVLNANAIAIATKAKQLAPVDIGGLRASIGADTGKLLDKHITVNANYAAYVEFGTGAYAAQYASTLPDNWQQFALQFKGKGKGNLYDFFNNILDWIKRKGITSKEAQYRVSATTTKEGKLKTRKIRQGTKAQKFEQDVKLAEAIAYKILKYGIHPHPYLYPAYEEQRGQIQKDIEAVLKSFGH